jgi:ubiquinone/menaquinone biosynthesis C-methylase UbiE
MSEPESRWAFDGAEADALRRRAESMWNRDYFERVVVPLLDVPADGTVLDVGTGFGALAFLLQSVRADLFITGVDSETGLVQEANTAARSLGLERMRFDVGDASSLPYDEGAFDLVMCQTLLAHVPDPGAVIAEMARGLKPGGVFFAAEWTDRALTALPANNVLAPTVTGAAETYRLTKAYSEGRRMLGRGDDEAGLRASLYARDAGLDVVDVRYSDRLWHAIPPYNKPSEQEWVESARSWTTEPVDEQFSAWAAEHIEAAGGTPDDVDRFFELTENPEDKRRWRDAIEAGQLAVISTLAMILTIARKPREPRSKAPPRRPR